MTAFELYSGLKTYLLITLTFKVEKALGSWPLCDPEFHVLFTVEIEGELAVLALNMNGWEQMLTHTLDYSLDYSSSR